MAESDAAQPRRYDLPLAEQVPPADAPQPLVRLGTAAGGLPRSAGAAADQPDEQFLSETMLLAHARWFCRLRWLVIAVLAGYGLLGTSPRTLDWLHLRQPGAWPFVLAGVLTLSNLFFRLRLGPVKRSAGPGGVLRNLWGQIVADLLVLAVAVHFIGSTQTYVAFVYLFHIVLACVVLSRRQSMLVTVLAMVLYGGCVLAEQGGIIQPGSVFAHPAPRPGEAHVARVALNTLSAMALWLAAWHLTSRLCRRLHLRDIELARTNHRLLAAQRERARHMLATTHQLRAPFAAICANAQVLEEGYCGELPEAAMPVVKRIIARCRRLAGEIQEMLQLANLRSEGAGDNPPAPRGPRRRGPMGPGLRRPDRARPGRHHRGGHQTGRGRRRRRPPQDDARQRPDQRRELLPPRRAGTRDVQTRPRRRGDRHRRRRRHRHRAEKLPKIFDEHYRTNEAMKHHRESSGLGLAIVRDVARLHGLGVSVTSARRRHDGRDSFSASSEPACEGRINLSFQAKDTSHGLRDDCR